MMLSKRSGRQWLGDDLLHGELLRRIHDTVFMMMISWTKARTTRLNINIK